MEVATSYFYSDELTKDDSKKERTEMFSPGALNKYEKDFSPNRDRRNSNKKPCSFFVPAKIKNRVSGLDC
jgi:hypothetical protein